MKHQVKWTLVASLLITGHILGPADAQTVAQFPVISPGQTEYTIEPDQAHGLIIQTLYLPNGFTLNVDPRVKAIDWSVNTIKVGEGATFDLSAPQTKPPRARNGGAPPRQADYCQGGIGGAAGGNGVPGIPGVNLDIHDVVTIDNSGSLWIRTDGGPGGDGGNGGNGQQGGGPHKQFISNHCGAGAGGPGGYGGIGGAGGATGSVKIVFKGDAGGGSISDAIAPGCAPSQRPSAAQGNSSVIEVWGAAGCPGITGAPGRNGLGG